MATVEYSENLKRWRVPLWAAVAVFREKIGFHVGRSVDPVQYFSSEIFDSWFLGRAVDALVEKDTRFRVGDLVLNSSRNPEFLSYAPLVTVAYFAPVMGCKGNEWLAGAFYGCVGYKGDNYTMVGVEPHESIPSIMTRFFVQMGFVEIGYWWHETPIYDYPFPYEFDDLQKADYLAGWYLDNLEASKRND